METIQNSIEIAAESRKVFDAITTTEGNKGWWTTSCEVGRKAGEQAVFRFRGGTIAMRFRIDRADAGKAVEWTCTGHEANPEWEGTRVIFQLASTPTGTRVDFQHQGWRERSKMYDECTGGWQYFLASLKSYVETGAGTPDGKK
jgi:uncharacterized protein YndB with AHSA1/START domain